MGAVLEIEIEAGLVAGDADRDALAVAGDRLVGELGVGEQRPGHGDEVARAGRDQPVGDLGRIDAVAGGHGHRHGRLEPADVLGEGRVRHHAGNGRHLGLVPAEAGADDIGAGAHDLLRDPHGLVPRQAALDQVEHGMAVDDEEVRAQGGADAGDHGERKARAVLEAAAPAVGAVVGAQRQELADQVALRAHHLDAVVAGLAGEAAGGDVVGDGLLDRRRRDSSAGVCLLMGERIGEGATTLSW